MSQWKKPFIFVKNFYLFLGMRFLMCVAGKGSRLECFAFVFRLGITHLVYDKKFFELRKVGKLTTIKPRKNWIRTKNLLPQKEFIMSHLIIELAPNSDDLQPSIQKGNEWKKPKWNCLSWRINFIHECIVVPWFYRWNIFLGKDSLCLVWLLFALDADFSSSY